VLRGRGRIVFVSLSVAIVVVLVVVAGAPVVIDGQGSAPPGGGDRCFSRQQYREAVVREPRCRVARALAG